MPPIIHYIISGQFVKIRCQNEPSVKNDAVRSYLRITCTGARPAGQHMEDIAISPSPLDI